MRHFKVPLVNYGPVLFVTCTHIGLSSISALLHPLPGYRRHLKWCP